MADTPDPSSILQKLGRYEAENRSTKPLYDEWAQSYENDLVNKLGYSAHRIAAEALTNSVEDRNATIMDIGCGTGLVGLELARHGFSTVDGLDISPEMISHARTKSIYRDLLIGDMNVRTAVPDAAYDAIICAGSFAPGHLGPGSHLEFIRIVKPGGIMVIFMNGVHFEIDRYEAHITALERQGLWQVISVTPHTYMTAVDRPGRLIMTRRT